jgi:hypothetical protein
MELLNTPNTSLDDAVAALAAIGAAAAADDLHGPAWAGWADYCWRTRTCASPADPAVVDAYIEEADLDHDEAEMVRAAVTEVDGR